jgi:hypothetical protein
MEKIDSSRSQRRTRNNEAIFPTEEMDLHTVHRTAYKSFGQAEKLELRFIIQGSRFLV